MFCSGGSKTSTRGALKQQASRRANNVNRRQRGARAARSSCRHAARRTICDIAARGIAARCAIIK